MSAVSPLAPNRPLGPDSLSWKLVGDWRLYTVLGRGLLLQVGHPAVGAGVAQHSTYKTDPFARLNRSLHGILGVVYGGEKAVSIASALRARHATIQGVDHHGQRYSALDPEPFHWVHATIFESVHAMCERFVRPLSPDEGETLYQESRSVGALYGLSADDMPKTLSAFWRYYDRMLRDRVEDNTTVREVLHQLIHPVLPLRHPLRPLWPAVRWPSTQALRLLTVGMLPAVVRNKWGLSWSRADEVALRALGRVLRGASLLPADLRYQPVARKAWRQASGRV